MVFTSWADWMFKGISLLLFILVMFVPYSLISSLFGAQHSRTRSNSGARVFGGFMALVFLIPWYLFVHQPIFDVIATETYVSTKFDVTPTWDQARDLRVLFSWQPPRTTWYPCDDILNLPKEQRLPALLKFASEVAVKDGRPLSADSASSSSTWTWSSTPPATSSTGTTSASSSAQDGPLAKLIKWFQGDSSSNTSPPPAPSTATEPAPPPAPAAPSQPAVRMPAPIYSGTTSTNFARDWVDLDGKRLNGITSVVPAPEGQVSILYANGGRNIPVAMLPQGFLDAWGVTPEKLKAADH
jgi:hypothetical protein